MNIIDKEKWLLAQTKEIKHHDHNFDFNESNKNHYFQIYEKIFQLINPDFNFSVLNKKILEIGPGVYACLLFCNNIKNCAIIESMEFPKNIQKIYKEKGIKIYQNPVENLNFKAEFDEVWVFNVMQHIWNPNVFIEKLKNCSNKILFFEPINTELNEEHVYSYTKEDFENYFPTTEIKTYVGRTIENFHTSDCVYGTWIRQ